MMAKRVNSPLPVRCEAERPALHTFTTRKFESRDLEECLSIRSERIGHECIGYKRALLAWESLAKSVAFKSVVIEAAGPIAGHRIVGFGASAFVSPEFAADAILNPRPGLNERIISSIDSGQSVVLTENQLRRQNTAGGLSTVILFTNWRQVGLSAEQISAIKLDLARAGVNVFSGYRLHRMMLEAIDSEDVDYIHSTGVYQMISNFRSSPLNSSNSLDTERGLFVIDRESAHTVVGSVAAIVFQFAPPILRFRKGDQQLLAAALEGLTDQELAVELKIKIQAIKKRWASVYRQVAETMPDLLPQSDNDADQKRGPQKRHHLLAYLRRHPEELRPFMR